MKALQVCSYYSSDFYKLLFHELEKLGVDSTVFYFAEKGTEPGDLPSGVRFTDCYSKFDRAFFKRKEAKVLRAYSELGLGDSYDISHAHSLFANGYISFRLKQLYGIPYVVAVRNTDVNVFFKSMPWLRGLGVEILRDASRVVFISPSYRDAVLASYVPEGMRGTIGNKADVIPNGINSLFFREEAPVAHDHSDGEIRLLQVGDVCKNKNQAGVLEACRLLRNDGVIVEYRVVGAVKDAKLAAKLSDGGAVLLPKAPQAELLDLYRNSDLFVMPSFTETFGLSYIEAMSQGLPVIYSKGQGIDGFFEDGAVGYSVDPDSPKSIKKGVLAAYEARERLRNSCIKESRRFDWKDIAAIYLKLYSSIYGG